jgi:hypothetical protein
MTEPRPDKTIVSGRDARLSLGEKAALLVVCFAVFAFGELRALASCADYQNPVERICVISNAAATCYYLGLVVSFAVGVAGIVAAHVTRTRRVAIATTVISLLVSIGIMLWGLHMVSTSTPRSPFR